MTPNGTRLATSGGLPFLLTASMHLKGSMLNAVEGIEMPSMQASKAGCTLFFVHACSIWHRFQFCNLLDVVQKLVHDSCASDLESCSILS